MSGILQLVNTFPSGGFAVKNSLRFRSSASAYLNRTPSVAGNRTTWTWSGWVKRGSLGSQQAIFVAGEGNSAGTGDTYFTGIAFGSDNKLATYWRSSLAPITTTTAVYRDCSAWYHIVLTANSTTLKAYVNGSEIASVSISGIGAINSTQAHLIGVAGYTAYFGYFDGYMAEINFVDGQALTPSSFGAFDATSGVWQATKYSGTYGTNGFYLKFSDTTSTTTLCYDYSGNSNNWTPNNISLTAGSTYDSMLDSPTNYDNGGNGVGNYAVLNPLKSTTPPTQGNMTFLGTGGSYTDSVYGSIGVSSSGKYYFEVLGAFIVGVNNSAVNVSVDQQTGRIVYHGLVGVIYNGSTAVQSGLPTVTTTDVVSVALNLDAGTLAFYKNNSQLGTNVSISAINTWWPFLQNANGNSNYVNFGQRPFAYTPPTGYKALNTQNLPTPSIQNGSNFMAATLYTGNGATQSISNAVNGVSFQPGLVWGKLRTTSSYHRLSDSVRGASLTLATNVTDAEVSGNGLVSFDATGFSMNSSTNINQVYPYVAWQWKAGGTAVTNTSGTITSQVSANTTAGFSVVTWTATGTGSTQTVGHGLGVTPGMVIVKSRTDGTTYNNWTVYHQSLASTYNVYLNLTAAAGTTPGFGWLGTPTSNAITLSVGTSGNNNVNSGNMVAYCFAAIPGYSAFGSYTGNGSADGPFVYTGFRPRFILIKGSSFVSNWFIEDASRNGYNVNNGVALRPNLSNAEDGTTTYDLDILSNGFKLRSSSGDSNSSGATFIYAAFAENPLKYSLAR